MATKTVESPANQSPAPQGTIVEMMAREEYFQILLAENAGDFKWGAHYVGINEYGMWLPREKPMLVAASILELIDAANLAIHYTDADGNPQITRRKDLQIMERRGPFTAQQAHTKRLECIDQKGKLLPGAMPVFPTKIPRAIADELASPSTSKG